MIFVQQNQKNFPEIFFFQKKIWEKKTWEKKFLKKNFEISFFQLQVIIASAHPVQISSRSDYCIILS